MDYGDPGGGGSTAGISKSWNKNLMEQLASVRSTDSSSLEQERKQTVCAWLHVGE